MKKLTPIKAIRQWCIDCCGFNMAEVRNCEHYSCPLWVYRMGRRPKKEDYRLQKKLLSGVAT